ncbi:uncharacterized protein N7446_011502 [Penicillium canescens]|uniref:C2H2-type domain-containing protein n=1 Tax=Penicillium canescens TaxID=5083 RepID=A0AAD6NB01_PENCN|nr:uncharacterized protein N7446_011502 [Penicillium canescens]KAJ6029154.1 hypothetical protein N7444_012141 [Penicillium canescens]KAJ6047585.1 hypothetical protein N7460_003732 [Penicillium canescens]KAJ6048819.1 hypothetical protein N7446_011502 [Penicillium canescens]
MDPVGLVRHVPNANVDLIRNLIPGMRSWLLGNTLGDPAHGVIELKVNHMDQSTAELRRLVYQGCADYAIIRTTKETKTPYNYAGATYTALLTENIHSKRMIGQHRLEIGQTVWVEAPTVVSAGFVFLIIKPTTSLSLDHGVTFERMARLEAENARLQQQMALSREIMEKSKINYVCPSRDCYEGFNDMKALKNHWKKRQIKHGYEDPHVRFLERAKDHPAFFAAYQSGLESDLPVTRVPPDHTCFRRDFIVSESKRDPPFPRSLSANKVLPDVQGRHA